MSHLKGGRGGGQNFLHFLHAMTEFSCMVVPEKCVQVLTNFLISGSQRLNCLSQHWHILLSTCGQFFCHTHGRFLWPPVVKFFVLYVIFLKSQYHQKIHVKYHIHFCYFYLSINGLRNLAQQQCLYAHGHFFLFQYSPEYLSLVWQKCLF